MNTGSIYVTPEHELLREQVARFVAREVEPHGEQWEASGFTPREVLHKLGGAGLLGLMYETQYGGAEGDAKTRAARQYLYHCAWLVTQGRSIVQDVSMLKALTGELVNEVVGTCQQFHGGMGYMRGSAIERLWRDARILAIGGGATEVMLDEAAKRY